MSEQPPTKAKVQPWSANTQVPQGAIRVDTYAKYQDLIGKWATGVLDDTLIAIGGAGLGKSETAAAALADWPHLYLKGQASKYGVYLKLAEHVDQPVVLDDIDTLLADSDVTGLLKMLLETRNPKVIQWTTGKTLSDTANVPTEIRTHSRTMILANELKLVSKNFGAVLDRSTIIWFNPSPAEIHKYVGSWFFKHSKDVEADREVYNFCGERIHLTPSPSCRYYYHGRKWKAAGLDWQQMVNDLMKPSDSKATLIKELLADKQYKTDKQRIEAWKEKTGESEQSYYAHKRAVGMASGHVSKRGRAISEAMKRKHAERKATKKE